MRKKELHIVPSVDKTQALVYYDKKYIGNVMSKEVAEVLVEGYNQDQKTIAALVDACEKSKGVADMGEFVDESGLRRDMLIISHLCEAALALAKEKK